MQTRTVRSMSVWWHLWDSSPIRSQLPRWSSCPVWWPPFWVHATPWTFAVHSDYPNLSCPSSSKLMWSQQNLTNSKGHADKWTAQEWTLWLQLWDTIQTCKLWWRLLWIKQMVRFEQVFRFFRNLLMELTQCVLWILRVEKSWERSWWE